MELTERAPTKMLVLVSSAYMTVSTQKFTPMHFGFVWMDGRIQLAPKHVLTPVQSPQRVCLVSCRWTAGCSWPPKMC